MLFTISWGTPNAMSGSAPNLPPAKTAETASRARDIAEHWLLEWRTRANKFDKASVPAIDEALSSLKNWTPVAEFWSCQFETTGVTMRCAISHR